MVQRRPTQLPTMVVKDKKGRKMVAPDGGWGWVVVLAVSVINLATRSIEPSFGLLFGDLLKGLGVATTGASLIMSTMDAVINFSGLFIGPLIKIYSYRKVAICGCFLSALGLMLTAPASSMTHILLTYSIIGGIGVGLSWSSTFVALNHYFSKYRGQAIGLSMAGTAVGFMVMPQAVQLLLREFDFQGAVLILGGVALHAVVGATLLQPIKWHLKPAKEDEENPSEKSELKVSEKEKEKLKKECVPEEPESQTALLMVKPKIEITGTDDNSKALLPGKRAQMPRITSSSSMAARRRKESVISNISSMDFTGSSFHIHTPVNSDDEEEYITIRNSAKTAKNRLQLNDINKNIEAEQELQKIKHKKKSYWKKIVTFFDLDLLKDPIFLNILFGLSIFYVAELNFKMVVPFFLADLGYNKSDTAFFLSMTAIADVLARIVLPPICDRVKITRRTIFSISAIFLGLSRSALAEQSTYVALMVALVINGFFRGATLINFNLTISEYCTLEKLPAGFGLHMVGKGIFIIALGPVIGVIRDKTESYPICIHFQTLFIFLCPFAWGIEYLVCKLRSRRMEKASIEDLT
ncbi:monocarboxylate transporter 9 [Anabrus simplex]|uniref:monocarboxylate transporter 9 n=1 Tax=Anabrus simplex TaxID=316456 RepID=UPI0034DD0D36